MLVRKGEEGTPGPRENSDREGNFQGLGGREAPPLAEPFGKAP